MFEMVMKMKAAHFNALRALGFSKDFIRDYSPIHAGLVYVAFKLAQRKEVA